MELSTRELRTRFNQAGKSCRDSHGTLLPREKLLQQWGGVLTIEEYTKTREKAGLFTGKCQKIAATCKSDQERYIDKKYEELKCYKKKNKNLPKCNIVPPACPYQDDDSCVKALVEEHISQQKMHDANGTLNMFYISEYDTQTGGDQADLRLAAENYYNKHIETFKKYCENLCEAKKVSHNRDLDSGRLKCKKKSKKAECKPPVCDTNCVKDAGAMFVNKYVGDNLDMNPGPQAFNDVLYELGYVPRIDGRLNINTL